MLRKEIWESEIGQRDLRVWSERLSWLGYDTKEQFEQDLWSLAEAYADVNGAITRPFLFYERFAGVRQGWAMFSSPQQYPVEVHVDVMNDRGWEPIYRPLSEEYDFWAPQFRHHRARKLVGRLARGFRRDRYNGFTRMVATHVAEAFPDSRRIRVRLYRYSTLPPAEVREGLEPEGRYEHKRYFRTDELR